MEARGFLLKSPWWLGGNYKKEFVREGSQPRYSWQVSASASARLISVIIPAHNEEQYLPGTLQALRRQNYPSFEVIVVANGCTDATAEVARGRCQQLIMLSRKNLGMARNLGAKIGRGEILVFLDADTVLEPMTLRRIAQEFTPESAAGTICGRPNSQRLSYKLLYQIKNLVHRIHLHPGSSGVILCWRSHFLGAGGFDEGLEVRENSELMRRLRKYGHYKYIGDITATTSMRRYDQKGFGHMAWLWAKLWLQSLLGDLHQRHYEAVR